VSRYEVDVLAQAVEHADDLFDSAPFHGMSMDQINRRYAEWIVEHLRDHGWRITRTDEEA
jgi:hypothetical protein